MMIGKTSRRSPMENDLWTVVLLHPSTRLRRQAGDLSLLWAHVCPTMCVMRWRGKHWLCDPSLSVSWSLWGGGLMNPPLAE